MPWHLLHVSVLVYRQQSPFTRIVDLLQESADRRHDRNRGDRVKVQRRDGGRGSDEEMGDRVMDCGKAAAAM